MSTHDIRPGQPDSNVLYSGHCSRHGAWAGGSLSCPRCSSESVASGPVSTAASVYHRHQWKYDGQTVTGTLVYHCDEHDPPVVRVVWPGVTL